MNPPTPFQPFGSTHLAALAVIALGGGALILAARRGWCPPVVRGGEHLLAVSLVVLPLWHLLRTAAGDSFDIQSALPLHYCDLASFAGATALWTRRQACCETVYFLGLAGTFQGLVTPALQKDYPDPAYFLFFAAHGTVVIAALYVVLGWRRAPGRGGVRLAMLVTTGYALFISLVNAALGVNYGFLCAKPPTASLMDWLGPWPWYVGSLWLLGLVLYLLLDLPFRRNRHDERRG